MPQRVSFVTRSQEITLRPASRCWRCAPRRKTDLPEPEERSRARSRSATNRQLRSHLSSTGSLEGDALTILGDPRLAGGLSGVEPTWISTAEGSPLPARQRRRRRSASGVSLRSGPRRLQLSTWRLVRRRRLGGDRTSCTVDDPCPERQRLTVRPRLAKRKGKCSKTRSSWELLRVRCSLQIELRARADPSNAVAGNGAGVGMLLRRPRLVDRGSRCRAPGFVGHRIEEGQDGTRDGEQRRN